MADRRSHLILQMQVVMAAAGEQVQAKSQLLALRVNRVVGLAVLVAPSSLAPVDDEREEKMSVHRVPKSLHQRHRVAHPNQRQVGWMCLP